MKKIAVIDGQGGGIGRQLVERLKKAGVLAHILALGTNPLATAAMKNAGADQWKTGDEAILKEIEGVDAIIGPIGLIIPNSLRGEISKEVANAIAESAPQKFLIPVNRCHPFTVVGLADRPLKSYLDEVVALVEKFVRE